MPGWEPGEWEGKEAWAKVKVPEGDEEVIGGRVEGEGVWGVWAEGVWAA